MVNKKNVNLPTQYINSIRTLGRSINTIISYKTTILSFIRYQKNDESIQMADVFEIAENGLDIEEVNSLILHIDNSVVEGYKKHLIQNHEPSGCNTKLIVMKAFYTWLIDKKYAEENFFETEMFSTPNRKPMAMNLNQTERFLTVVASGNTKKDERDFVIMNLVVNTGLRIGETLKLTPRMIKEVAVEDGLIYYLDIIGKGRKQREAVMAVEVYDMLADYIKKNNIGIDDKIFDVTPRTVERNMKGYLEKAKLDGKYTPHKLRHTYATMMYASGVPIEQISEYLGHESINTTMNFYVRTSDEQRKKASESHPLSGKIFR